MHGSAERYDGPGEGDGSGEGEGDASGDGDAAPPTQVKLTSPNAQVPSATAVDGIACPVQPLAV